MRHESVLDCRRWASRPQNYAQNPAALDGRGRGARSPDGRLNPSIGGTKVATPGRGALKNKGPVSEIYPTAPQFHRAPPGFCLKRNPPLPPFLGVGARVFLYLSPFPGAGGFI
jgi:hypothetical protein